ncbi:MAG TPA: zf-HC2 domain-containing protein [Steroidobacteraceae bacterium]
MTHDRESTGALCEHQACWELLPWRTNGRLSSQDSLLVETHLAHCEECRTELRVQEELFEQINRGDALVLAPQASLQKLLARLDADDAPATTQPNLAADAGNAEEVASLKPAAIAPSARPRQWLMIAVAAQGLVIAILFGALWWQVDDSLTEPRFATLTSEPAVIPQGPAIRVVFDNDVGVRDINELLQSLGAQVIAGPGQAGVYTLALEPQATPDSDVATVLSKLRADARVVFAEPAVSAAQPR